eukprot:1159306-Pelagomonas_calceolata.AAC.25
MHPCPTGYARQAEQDDSRLCNMGDASMLRINELRNASNQSMLSPTSTAAVLLRWPNYSEQEMLTLALASLSQIPGSFDTRVLPDPCEHTSLALSKSQLTQMNLDV